MRRRLRRGRIIELAAARTSIQQVNFNAIASTHLIGSACSHSSHCFSRQGSCIASPYASLGLDRLGSRLDLGFEPSPSALVQPCEIEGELLESSLARLRSRDRKGHLMLHNECESNSNTRIRVHSR